MNELEWLDQEICEINKESHNKKNEKKGIIKFLLFLIPFVFIGLQLQGVLFCPHCDMQLDFAVEKEVQWHCHVCRYYNSDSSGGDWAGDYYCGKCGAKK